MGYDLRITREQDSADRVEITLDEWLAVVQSNDDFQLTGFVEARSPRGETIRYESRGLAEWRTHPSGELVPFDFRHGEVIVKNPDEATIERMKALASQLQGRVRGDEGEFYD